MIVYVVINEKVIGEKIVVNIIGVYSTHDEAMKQYMEHIDSGQYSIYPTIIGQTSTNTIITEYKRSWTKNGNYMAMIQGNS